jgi:hypothetical protein
MTRRPSIGGVMTANAYAALAGQHRPRDPSRLAAEVHRLHATGLSARDISQALRLPLDQTINVLSAMPSGVISPGFCS